MAAERYYARALETYRRLAKDNPQAHEPNLAKTLNNMVTVYKRTQRFDEAETVCKEALEIRTRLAKDNPQTYERDVATTLNNLASVYYAVQRFNEAEEMYKKALEIRRQMAKNNSPLSWAFVPPGSTCVPHLRLKSGSSRSSGTAGTTMRSSGTGG